ncbi:4-hydroxy-tetrahydrodipicolinate synthase [archaeon D22]|nr:4-hydroxy-tetrahydrodipicolinate synthase [archaeon D22]
MTLEKFHGTTTALITPFNEDESVNYEGYKQNLDAQIEGGVNGLLVLGTTGETPTLTNEEQIELIKITVEKGKASGVPVMVGVGTNNTKTTVENSKLAEELGADALLVVTPYYNKPTNGGIMAHFTAVNDAVNTPIVVYNIAGRTGKNIDTKTMKELAKLSNVEAVKEASGDINQMMDVIREIPDLTVLSGDDGITCPLMAMGGKGVISVASNVFPKLVSDMTTALLDEDYETGRNMHYELMPLFSGLFMETNPLPVKTAMGMVGLNGGAFRLPMTPMQDDNIPKLQALIDYYKQR